MDIRKTGLFLVLVISAAVLYTHFVQFRYTNYHKDYDPYLSLPGRLLKEQGGFVPADPTPATGYAIIQRPEKRVFVSSRNYKPSELRASAGNGDSLCQELATQAGFSGKWVSWTSVLSTTTNSNARKKIVDAVYTRLDGQIIARSKNDLLDGSLLNPIEVTEQRGKKETEVWTGTRSDGSANDGDCNDWTSDQTTKKGTTGMSTSVTGSWTKNRDSGCNNAKAVYCFEQ